MKTRKSFKPVVFLLALAACLLFAGKSVQAQTFSGNVCFAVHVTEGENGPKNETVTMKMHVVPLDKIQSSVSGVAQIPGDGPFVVSGIGFLQGSAIILNLTTTQAHTSESWRDSGTMQARLNPTTLKGTFWTIGHDFNPETHEFDSTYAAGTLSKVACK